MKIDCKEDGEKLLLGVEGKLDATASSSFRNTVKPLLDGKTEVVADFGDVKYVSSAGIRELLSLYKTMKAKGGSFSIINAGESIKEVFEITGFWDLLSGG